MSRTLAAALAPALVLAQAWPQKPVKLIRAGSGFSRHRAQGKTPRHMCSASWPSADGLLAAR